MRVLSFLMSFIWLLPVQAVEFTSIARNEPVTLTYTAEFSTYADITLALDAKELADNPLYLRIMYVIGGDTLFDNLTVKGGHKGMVKQLLMKEGEHLIAQIYLNNAEMTKVDGIEGSFRAVSNTTLTVSKDMVGTSFPGRVWIREHNPLFRVKFEEAAARNVDLTFHFDGNYEFGELHFKVKVISPEQGILYLPRTIDVTDEAVLNFREKTVKVTLEGVNFSYPGSYYFQVMHTMAQNRVNGIVKVSYEVVPQ